jgi:gamma-glutamyltranspeptidase/glutathione hydrolase
LPGREAVALARMHHQWMPDRVSIEEQGVPEGTLTALRAMGHDITTTTRQGDAQTIWVGPDGTPYGANDRRSADSKAAVPRNLTSPSAGR